MVKTFGWTVGALGLGIAYVLAVGVLSVQTMGARAGAKFDLNNELVSVTSPTIPVLPMLGTALLSALVLYAVTFGLRKRSTRTRISVAMAFAAGALSLVVWSLTMTPAGVLATEGIPLGWEGWIKEGGTSPAVHVVIILALGALWPSSSLLRYKDLRSRGRQPVQPD
ncbi:MAG: hypothetical protein QOH68_71 [Nocardioidaceae bacterium]|jgi:hypothetical protein|nr:hypothetical protein [Nocardioidaceae bacterium]